MRTMLAVICVLVATLVAEGRASAQNLIWSGAVDSRGARTNGPVLCGARRYIIRASGSIYFGRWWRNSLPLNDDACYEYTAKGAPDPLPVFTNSYGVAVCDGQYRASHVYQSAAFTGRNGPISFWIVDTDYRDNSGALRVDIFDVGSAVAPGPGVVDDQYCRDLYARGDAANRAGNNSRDRGDIVGARNFYQQALALFRQGESDPRCARLRGQFANAAQIVERNLGRVGQGPAPGRRVFNNPTMNGALVDHCINWATNCDAPAATMYCQRMGMRRGVSWTLSHPGRTWVMGDNRYCQGGFCAGFGQIVCE